MGFLGIGKKIRQIKLLSKIKSLWGDVFTTQRKVRIIMPNGVAVEVKPAWQSKINIAAIISGVAAILKLTTSVEVPEDFLKEIESLVVLGSSIVTFIARTWFSTKLTPASAKKTVR